MSRPSHHSRPRTRSQSLPPAPPANPLKRKLQVYVELPPLPKRARVAPDLNTNHARRRATSTSARAHKRDPSPDADERVLVRVRHPKDEKRAALEAAWCAKEAEWRAREQTLVQQTETLASAALARETALLQDLADAEARADRLASERSTLLLQPARAARRCLDDAYTCPLCYELLAAPYTVAAATCGHTFCALCLLKWFLTCMHDCGTWHTDVQCPICRAGFRHVPVVEGPGHEPRNLRSMSFVPNRLARAAIRELLQVLEQPVVLAESDAAPAAESKRARRSRKHAHDAPAPAADADPELALWAAQGASRLDWDARDATGETEMQRLRNAWATLEPDGFLLLKHRLGLTAS